MTGKNGHRRHVPRVALDQQESAEALGMSVSFFVDEVAPEVPVIRRRRKKLYRLRSLEEWAEKNEALDLEVSQ